MYISTYSSTRHYFEVSWQIDAPIHLLPVERALDTLSIGGLGEPQNEVGRRNFLPLPGLKVRPLGRPVRSP
jgi:hypothetical protein